VYTHHFTGLCAVAHRPVLFGATLRLPAAFLPVEQVPSNHDHLDASSAPRQSLFGKHATQKTAHAQCTGGKMI
jgi:hypothetical protein